ncbi:MAG: glycosyltransferase family 4 protein [Anaerolineae bacterium]|nr:glycosyltransferase family 4 protein [Anaerolineae bacterium]
MKIGYLLQQHVDIQTPPFSGPANHVREVVEHLQHMGHEVRVVVNIQERYYYTDDLATFHPITVPWLDKGPLRWLEKAVRRIQYELKLPYAAFFESLRFGTAVYRTLQGFDLLFERMSWASYGGAVAARWLRIPLVLENNGDHLADLEAKGIAPQGMQRKLSLSLTGWGVQQAAHVVVSGDGWRREFIKRWGVAETAVTTVENGTVLVGQLTREQLRSFGAEPARDEPLFVYLGGFYPWQGVLVLLRAFAQARQQGMCARLQLIGSGSGLAEAEQLVTDLDLTACVSFTGRLSPAQYAPLLADADVGLAPYCGWPEFSGLKTFDYKAAGLPTISTGQEGMPATLAHGRTALIIPPCDEMALTEAMQQLAAQPDTRRQMGQAARLEAEQEHTWGRTVERLVDIFEPVRAASV